MNSRHRLPLAVALLAAFAVAVPAVLAADPSPRPGPPDHAAAKGHGAKAPKIEVSLSGTVEQTTDEKGRPTFTLTADGTTYELSAGPKWYHGENGGPLAAFVGERVDVHGWQREGSSDVSVDTVNGERVVPEGRPPWAGGPKAVGERHPGWKADKPGRGLGREQAPGQLKDKSADEGDAST
jgi:hypothetical protein